MKRTISLIGYWTRTVAGSWDFLPVTCEIVRSKILKLLDEIFNLVRIAVLANGFFFVILI